MRRWRPRPRRPTAKPPQVSGGRRHGRVRSRPSLLLPSYSQALLFSCSLIFSCPYILTPPYSEALMSSYSQALIFSSSHSLTLHYDALRCTALPRGEHSTTLPLPYVHVTMHCGAFFPYAVHRVASPYHGGEQRTTVRCIALRSLLSIGLLACIALRCSTVRCIALRSLLSIGLLACTALHCSTVRCVPLPRAGQGRARSMTPYDTL